MSAQSEGVQSPGAGSEGVQGLGTQSEGVQGLGTKNEDGCTEQCCSCPSVISQV